MLKDKKILPREKILTQGIECLTNSELLAVILRTGNKNLDIISFCENILRESKDFKGLSNYTLNELLHIDGIGIAKACQIFAIFEISRRVNNYEYNEKILLDTPDKIYKFIIPKLRFKEREYLYILSLNSMLQLMSNDLVSIGTVNNTQAHPREIFHFAIRNKASAFAIVHNHPSGNILPSSNDILLTKRICEVSEVMQIQFVEHLVITDNDYYSMKANGYIN